MKYFPLNFQLKQSSFLLLFLLIIASSSVAQESFQAQKEEINKIMSKQVEDWNNGNVEGFMQAYWQSDSLLFIGSRGPQYGWETTLEKYKKSYPDAKSMGELKFDGISFIHLSDEHIHLSGKWQLNRQSDTLKGYYSLVWKKINNEWKIIYDHSSSEKND